MAENKKTPQNEKQAATVHPERDTKADGIRIGLSFKEHPLYIDDNDRIYYIDDDGEHVYKITVDEILTEEQREKLQAATEKLMGTILKNQQITKTIHKAYNKMFTPEFKELLQSIKEDLQKSQEAASIISEIDELQPYIETELKKDEYGGITIDDLLGDNLPDLYDRAAQEDSTLYKVLNAARAARNTALLSEPYKAEKMLLPTDKINLFAWDMKETSGQIKFNLSRGGNNDGATALYSLTFDDDPNVKLTKEIDHFDKAVVSAVGTAYNSGNKIISATGIYYAIGGTGKPDATTIERINKSLTKLDMGKVYIDNTAEAQLYNYERFQKEDRLLHFKRVTAIANGKVSDAFIQILEEPILMTFARQRNQISAVPIKVLQSPISKTNNHLKIQDYLLWRIVQRRRELNKLKEQQQKKYTQNRQRDIKEKAKLTIALKTFYEHTGNSKKDSTAKKRARSTAEKYLQHYQSDAAGNWIESYTMDKENIIIYLPVK